MSDTASSFSFSEILPIASLNTPLMASVPVLSSSRHCPR